MTGTAATPGYPSQCPVTRLMGHEANVSKHRPTPTYTHTTTYTRRRPHRVRGDDDRPSLFIERFCSKLKMQPELIKLSIFIAKKIEEHSSITDNIPPAIAAGLIYFVSYNCNLSITKLEIRKITGICDVTINKCFQKMEKIKTELIPPIIFEKYR